MTVRYRAPGDMTIIAWYAWFVETDPATDEDRIVKYGSRLGHTWDDVPEDGCLGLRLIHAAKNAEGTHRAITATGDYYGHADSNLGDVWIWADKKEDVDPARYRNLKVARGKWIPYEAWAPIYEEMTNLVK